MYTANIACFLSLRLRHSDPRRVILWPPAGFYHLTAPPGVPPNPDPPWGDAGAVSTSMDDDRAATQVLHAKPSPLFTAAVILAC